MTRIHELQYKKAGILDKMRAMNDAAPERAFTDDEQAVYDNLKTEAKDIDGLIARATDAIAIQIANAKADQKPSAGELKDYSRYSIVKAVRESLAGGLTGIEAEMNDAACQEAKRFGTSITGFGVPARFLKFQKRDMTVGVATEGGDTVQTDIGDLIPFLNPRLKTMELGATPFTGLVGNLDLPVNDALGAAQWEGENDADVDVNPTFAKISLAPKRLAGTTPVSKQLLAQSSIDVERFVRENLSKVVAIALDTAAINGSGAANQPLGILNTSGIGSVVGGTNGALPDWADIIDLESAIAVQNADMGRLAYLTTPGIRGRLKQTEKASGTAQFIWAQDLNGYSAEVSTQVPSTLTKGTSVGVCHAIIFGNWEELIVAQWGGLDITVDPYTRKREAMVEITVNSWWDIALKHAASFAAMKDALIV